MYRRIFPPLAASFYKGEHHLIPGNRKVVVVDGETPRRITTLIAVISVLYVTIALQLRIQSPRDAYFSAK
jgi:hypothetical protein